MLQKTQFGANDNLDMVVLTIMGRHPRIPYQTAFEISQSLRIASKYDARQDRANASFWRDVDIEDLNDCPKPNKIFRRSSLSSTVRNWSVDVQAGLVALTLDSLSVEFDYETAIKFHQIIRRAGRRAKAWAGDRANISRCLGNLTDAEEDYKLGLN